MHLHADVPEEEKDVIINRISENVKEDEKHSCMHSHLLSLFFAGLIPIYLQIFHLPHKEVQVLFQIQEDRFRWKLLCHQNLLVLY